MAGSTVTITAVNPPQLSSKAAAAWTRWRKMLESYTKITKLTDKDPEERVAVLITDIGIDTLKIYTALPFANEREKNDLKRKLDLF